MKNNKLIKHKENIFIKIFNFIKKNFFVKKESVGENVIEKIVAEEKENDSFFENIQFKKDSEEIRLIKLRILI